jgi:hypothetical protein
LLSCPVCRLQAVKVNSLGKWKTALQMTSMSMLLFCKDETGWMERQLAGEGRGAPRPAAVLDCWYASRVDSVQSQMMHPRACCRCGTTSQGVTLAVSCAPPTPRQSACRVVCGWHYTLTCPGCQLLVCCRPAVVSQLDVAAAVLRVMVAAVGCCCTGCVQPQHILCEYLGPSGGTTGKEGCVSCACVRGCL